MKAIAMIRKLETYAGLVQQIRNDLRLQHPDWVQPNGQCPMCDSYEARLLELLDVSTTGEANEHSLPPIFSYFPVSFDSTFAFSGCVPNRASPTISTFVTSRPVRHLFRERALRAIGIVLHAKVFVDLQQALLVRDGAQKSLPTSVTSKKARRTGFEAPVR